MVNDSVVKIKSRTGMPWQSAQVLGRTALWMLRKSRVMDGAGTFMRMLYMALALALELELELELELLYLLLPLLASLPLLLLLPVVVHVEIRIGHRREPCH
jgi:hypothetical protein